MHELSIAQALVTELTEIARREKGARITAVALSVGTLAGVDGEALRFVFPFAAQGTMAEGARLDLKVIPSRLTCKTCGRSAEATPPFAVCACGSADVEIAGGRDLTITSVEIES
jgi:hydrogenase nickel incorporation protein HypA/HybF